MKAAREWVLAGIVVAVVMVVGIREPAFVTPDSLLGVLTDTAFLFMMALAQMSVMLTRGIDLSVAANLALTGMVCALLDHAHPDLPIAFVVILAIVFGAALGLINALLIAKLAIPPIVVTLGTLAIFRGMIFVIGDGAWLTSKDMSPAFLALPKASCSVFRASSGSPPRCRSASGTISTTRASGRALYAVGGNPVAARYCGIDLPRQQLIVYALSGAVSGLCGYLWVARYGIAYSDIALGYELTVIAACVIGGVSIAGGVGTAQGALLGALFLGVIVNALPVINVSPFWQMAISGAVILAAVIVNSRAEKRSGKLILPEARRAAAGGRRMSALPASPVTPVAPRYAVADAAPRRFSDFALRWETILVGLLVLSVVVNSLLSPYFLDLYNLLDSTFNFSEKAIIALGMALLIMVREIDLSVAAIVALCSLLMGFAASAGADTAVLFLIALGVGALCGAVNGALTTALALPSIVVTIGTMSLFRGIAQVALGDQALTQYPPAILAIGQGYHRLAHADLFRHVSGAGVGRGDRPAPHAARPPHLRHRRQSRGGAVLRHSGGAAALWLVRFLGPVVGPGGVLLDRTHRLNASEHRAGLGARSGDDGDPRRRLDRRRLRHDRRRRSRGLRARPHDLRHDAGERAWHRHQRVDRGAADRHARRAYSGAALVEPEKIVVPLRLQDVPPSRPARRV